jgi:hypothetical protein
METDSFVKRDKCGDRQVYCTKAERCTEADSVVETDRRVKVGGY